MEEDNVCARPHDGGGDEVSDDAAQEDNFTHGIASLDTQWAEESPSWFWIRDPISGTTHHGSADVNQCTIIDWEGPGEPEVCNTSASSRVELTWTRSGDHGASSSPSSSSSSSPSLLTYRATLARPIRRLPRTLGGAGIACMAVGCMGLGACGSSDGFMSVWSTRDGSIRHELPGHPLGTLCMGFFPSGEVLLTGGADMRARVWSATDGYHAAELAGHTGGVLGLDFVDRGRNVVTVSRDATAKLWDVSTQSCLHTWKPDSGAINACALMCCTGPGGVAAAAPAATEGEVGSSGKVLALATESGALHVVDLRARESVAHVNQGTTVALNTVVNAPSWSAVVAGSHEGHVTAWDVRRWDEPLWCQRRSVSPIQTLHFASDSLWVADGEGLVWMLSHDSPTPTNAEAEATATQPRLTHQLLGAVADAVVGVQLQARNDGGDDVDVQRLWTGCRDGVVREYVLPQRC